MNKVKKILIMAGGTGGHVFPGLAVAHYFSGQQEKLREGELLGQKEQYAVYWMGTRNGIEATLVPNAGFPIYFIDIKGLRGKGLFSLFLTPFRLLRAIFQAIKIIQDVQPDAVLGMGGFVSGPGGVASWLLGKKLVIHEQNAKSGLTNRWLAKIATRVLEGFPNTFAQRKSVVTTGNPVRKEIALIPSPQKRLAARTEQLSLEPFLALNNSENSVHFKLAFNNSESSAHSKTPRLLILGGSLGAEAINKLLPRALAMMPEETRPIIYHQSGEKHFHQTVQAYADANVVAEVVPFIKEMDKAYVWADFVICRAGALTIAELCAAGVGAILIPFPHAVDDHQTANANFMANGEAAVLMQQASLSEDLLKKKLDELCSSPDKRLSMAEAAYRLRQVDAVKKVCWEVCQ